MRWPGRGREERERDLERELQADLELETAEQQERGLAPDDARHSAQRAFGNAAVVKEDVRRAWGWTALEIAVQELRYALRTMRKSPAFTATAILTLALAIGAGTAVFTLLDSVVLKPLAWRDSGRLVVAWERVLFLSSDVTGPNPRHVDLWRRRATAFSSMTLLQYSTNGLSRGGEHPALVGIVRALPNLFDILQVKPLIGRTFLPADGVRGRDDVVILSYPLWKTLFSGGPGVIGTTVRIADVPRRVIGVLPPGFHFPNANALRSFRSGQPVSGAPDPAVFLPAALDLTTIDWNADYGNWVAIGRLRPGVSIGQAEAQLNAIEAQIVQQMPANQRDDRPGALLASVQPMQEAVVGDSRIALWLLMAAVSGLMLIAALNLANAQIGRALARQREAAVRVALGAARWRLIWNALAESLLFAIIGGAAGVLLAQAALSLFRRSAVIDLPRLAEVHLNPSVLLFALATSIAVTLVSGLLPACSLFRVDPQSSLQQNGNRAAGTRHGGQLRTWLIGLQVFGCTVLLLLTGLFAKNLLQLLDENKGFETAHVAIAEVRLPPKTYATNESRVSFDDGVLQALRSIPGVQTAAMVSAMPLEGESWIESVNRVDRPNLEALINFRWVSAGYFEAMHESLLRGRFFTDLDRSTKGVVISASLGEQLWPGENALGGQLRIEGRTFTVIGVVADSRSTSLKSAPSRMAYAYYTDRPPYTGFFIVRGTASADSLVSRMRDAIWQHAPEITIARVKTMDAQVADSLAAERFRTLVLLAFGAAALLLAMLGIYGVLSYLVVTRRQEIGIRMALGATRRAVYALVLGEAGGPVLGGIAAGFIASILAGDVIKNRLYGIHVLDAPVILMVAALFVLCATAAAFLPARRAASVDPMETLRSQ